MYSLKILSLCVFSIFCPFLLNKLLIFIFITGNYIMVLTKKKVSRYENSTIDVLQIS
jgi:hypothetical protein